MNGKKKIIILRLKCCKRQKNRKFCKVNFAKIKKKAFFLMPIRYISQKYIIFAPRFTKNGTKLLKKIQFNKLKLKIYGNLHY